MHIEKQSKKSGEYYYLVETLRLSEKKWKKVRIYLGKNLTKKQLKRLEKHKKRQLLQKIKKEKETTDPLLTLLSKEKIRELESVRKSYNKNIKKINKLQRQNYYEHFVSEFTYNTNAIEGSTLSLHDTSMILFEKVVPEGKSIREINEVQNHKDAFDYMIRYKGDLKKIFVLRLHELLIHNIIWKYAGVFRNVQVYIRGSDFVPTKPDHIEHEFKKLMFWYRSNKKKYHPVILAAYLHYIFESIHPFYDGNGRVGRLVLNFILRKNGFPLINIKYKNRSRYYEALQQANQGNLKPLVDLITSYLIEFETLI